MWKLPKDRGILAQASVAHTMIILGISFSAPVALAQSAGGQPPTAKSPPWQSITWTGGPNRSEYIMWDTGHQKGWAPCAGADFNGDGITDIICLPGDAENDHFQWTVGISNGKGFSSTTSYDMYMPEHKSDKDPELAQCFLMDMTGTGSNRPVCLLNTATIKDQSGNTIRGQLNVMSYFNGQGSSMGSNVYYNFKPFLEGSVKIDKCFPIDLNGDGRQDIICGTITDPSGDNGGSVPPPYWVVYLSQNTSPPTFSEEYWYAYVGTTPTGTYSQDCIAGDFNGDGNGDLACWVPTTNQWEFLYSPGATPPKSAQTGLQLSIKTGGPPVYRGDIGNCFAGDFNGDGVSDIACYSGANGNWYITTNTAASSSVLVTNTWVSGVAPASPANAQCQVVNLNGDNLADIVCSASSAGSSSNENQWSYAISTGIGFNSGSFDTKFDVLNTSPNTFSQSCAFGDFNGDGITDIACTNSTSGGKWWMGLSPGSK